MRVESGGQTHIHCRSSGQSKEFVWSFFFFFSVPQGAVENLKRSGEQDLTYLTLNTFRKDSCGRTRVEGDKLLRRLLYSYPSERC